MAKMSSGLLESAVSGSLSITSKTDRQTWRTDRQTFKHKELPLGCRLTFRYPSHLEKYAPPEVLRQSRD